MLRSRYAVIAALAAVSTAQAGWKDDVGYTRLQQTFGGDLPSAVLAGVTQVEAGDSSGNNYLPNSTNSAFTGKTITNKSPGSGASSHANGVGSYFYGNTNSLIPSTTTIDAYNATHWQGTGFLNFGTSLPPLSEPRRIQNHSWIGTYNRANNTLEAINGAVTNTNQRLDYAIAVDGFVSVVGVGNGHSTTLPDLLCQGYHTVSVGRVDGQHSAGLTAFDTAGRMKPDLVSFETVTSNTTPQVASAAGLIYQKLSSTSYTPALSAADYPPLVKALLLAGAAKEPLSSWTRSDTSKPYDARYGAGALNVFLSHRILLGGRHLASGSSLVLDSGWNIASASSDTPADNRTYFFEISGDSAPVPFSAALTWHRTFGSSVTLANLDLRLYAVSSDTFTLGALVDASLSSVDNVEHLYRATLAPGRYALQVTSASSTPTPYALAWRTSPAVSVVATTPDAHELGGTAAVFTVSRTGPTTSPLFVPLIRGGSAVSGTHYIAPAASVLIPAGASSATVEISPVSDFIPQGDRTVTLSAVSDFSLTAGSTASATITIHDRPYDGWRVSRFTPGELTSPSVSGDTADPDADGRTNLLEYALGSEPKSADPDASSPVVGTEAGRITLAYTRPTSPPPDVSYAAEWSADLQTWTTGSAVVEAVSSIDNGDGTTTVLVRSVTSLTTSPRQFLRLRVTRL